MMKENKKYIGNKEKLRRANQKIAHLKKELEEKDYYEYRYTELRKQWNRLVDELLGENYYNYGCDTYSCDEFTVDDLIYKYKKGGGNFGRRYKDIGRLCLCTSHNKQCNRTRYKNK